MPRSSSSFAIFWWTLNEYNSLFIESVLFVHTPITILISWRELTSCSITPFFLATCKIWFFSRLINEALPGGVKTKSAFFVESTLDQIIESNKTHDRKVALVFEGKETTDEKEILDIKHSLSGTYEVSINYDDKGYVSKIVLEKLEQKSNSDYIQEKIEESEKAIESSNEDLKKKVEEMQEEARSFFDN